MNGTQKLYVCVGEKGSNSPSNGTFNSGNYTEYTYASCCGGGYAYAGGGASDIRLREGDWSSFDGLKARIMIAGGGGGAATYYAYSTGGYGGGLIGGSGSKYGVNGSIPLGGSQIAGGTATNGVSGSFGIGGNRGGVGKGGGGFYGCVLYTLPRPRDPASVRFSSFG